MNALFVIPIIGAVVILGALYIVFYTDFFELQGQETRNGNVTEPRTSYVCGNGIRESGEFCDGDDLGVRTCQDFGYTNGSLSCSETCSFDKSDCFSNVCNFDLFCDPEEDYRGCPSDCEPPEPETKEGTEPVMTTGGGNGGSSDEGPQEEEEVEEKQTDYNICNNAANGGLCGGLDITYGDGYENLCCEEHGLCC